ncbi:helix-turn-helix domain-containing protein [Nocardioides donggukensis]|uniref:Helix-turn-helix domain-containing protein n=1 Tax=Nocardioides donggukensis TaxID=2774019 RepID=A0A927Q283_9ACTN|nr:helix-turn-helix domain-containing protein [Nocardioides donggukensis]MBD8869431.1 helix-turn-helix domain-containing protein [Nocardioides donggukensis]
MDQDLASEDPETALAAVLALRRQATLLERRAVGQALGQGWTWAQVGQALGISAQAAHKKFARDLRGRPSG